MLSLLDASQGMLSLLDASQGMLSLSKHLKATPGLSANSQNCQRRA